MGADIHLLQVLLVIHKLRAAEVGLAKGQSIQAVCKRLEITEQTYYRWRKEYGGCGWTKPSA